MEVKTGIILTITLLLLILLFLKKMSLLETMVFLLPFKSINFDFVLMIWAYYIPLVFLLFKLVFLKTKIIKVDKHVLIFAAYIIIGTVIISNFFIDKWMMNDYFSSFFRGKGRYISSLFKIIFFDFGVLLVVYSLVNSMKKLQRLVNVFLFSLTFIAILGVFQMFIFSTTGFDMLPIGMSKNGNIVTALSDALISNSPTIRVNSLGGEPKGLAAIMAIALGLSYYLGKNRLISKRKSKWLFFLFFTTLVLTLSSGGFGLFFIFILLITGQKLLSLNAYRRLKKSTLILIPVFLLSVFLSWNVIYRVFDSRILSRSSELLSEEADTAIQTYFSKNPEWLVFGSGTGNVHHLAYPYIPKHTEYYLKGNIFVSRYGYMRIISENGIIGFILFSLIFISILTRLYYIKDIVYRNYADFFFSATLMVYLFFIVRSNYVLSEMMLICGLSLSFISLVKKEKSIQLNIILKNA